MFRSDLKLYSIKSFQLMELLKSVFFSKKLNESLIDLVSVKGSNSHIMDKRILYLSILTKSILNWGTGLCFQKIIIYILHINKPIYEILKCTNKILLEIWLYLDLLLKILLFKYLLSLTANAPNYLIIRDSMLQSAHYKTDFG